MKNQFYFIFLKFFIKIYNSKIMNQNNQVTKQISSLQQRDIQQPIQSHSQQKDSKINWTYCALFSFFYFIQGIVMSFPTTMPYVYQQLPDYSTMAIFNTANLPFSFKFIFAPFLERYNFVEYGKRKTWIIRSLIIGGAAIIFMSFFTGMQYANLFAILCILSQFCMAILDISTHAVMIKQLKSPTQASTIQCYSQTLGVLVGGLLILKLTSKQYANSVGLSEPITTPQTLILIIACLTLFPVFIVHFKFKETVLESQKRGSKLSFCKIVSYYQIFLKPNSRYFRGAVYFLIFHQGFNFFNSLYDYNLVQAGFQRNTLNSISNITNVASVILSFYFGHLTKLFRGKIISLIISSIGLILLGLYLVIVFPLEIPIIIITKTLFQVLSIWQFFIYLLIINQFPVHALTGMFITMNVSLYNIGKLTSVHTLVCGKFGWKLCTLIGLGLQLVITVLTPTLFKWMEEGDTHVPLQIEQSISHEKQHNKQPQQL